MTRNKKNIAKKKLIICIIFLNICVGYTQNSSIKLTVAPDSIFVGQPIKLSWKVLNAENIYISYLGKVDSFGSQILYPEKTTTLSIIAEGWKGILSINKEVTVKGYKGDEEDDCPKSYMLQYPFSYKIENINYTDFLDVIHNVLQDSMNFSLKNEHKIPNGPFVFLTNCAQKSYLLNKSEKTIGSRRIAYIVEVKELNNSNNLIEYTIRTAIQYKKRIVRTWRRETNEDIYLQEIKRLKEKIFVALAKFSK